ncbi:MAG: energy transducer TonB [Rikenellaceae bacterium]
MKKLLTLLMVALAICTLSTTQAKDKNTASAEKAYAEAEVDRIPTFRGAHFSEFSAWLEHYTSYYTLSNRVREQAYVRCVIETTGEVSELEVYNCSSEFARAIERTISNIPRVPLFAPALKGGEAVRYRTSFSVSYRAKFEQVYTTTSYYRDNYYYREPTTFQRINHYTRSGHMRDTYPDPTRDYGVSYYSRTKVTNRSVYRNMEVSSSECEYFKVDDVDSYPMFGDNKSFVEYVDWIMEGVYPVIERVNNRANNNSRVSVSSINFELLIDKDGTVYPSSQMLTSKGAINRAIVSRIGQSPKLIPATRDGEAVRYRSSFLVSMKRVNLWPKLTFAQQVKWSMAEDVTFGTTDVDVLPRYGNMAMDSYFSEVTRRAYINIPDNIRGGIEDDVRLDVIIDKSGRMTRIEVVDAMDEDLTQAAVDAVKSMTHKWTPATVYGNAVDCRLGVTISFGDVYSEYVDTGIVGVERYNKPEFRRQDAREFIDWVKSRVKMPSGAKSSDYRGVAFVSFVVERDGSLSEVEVVRSNDEHLAQEVKRIVSKSPKWYAGTDENGAARVRIAVPIVFI